jgi:uncharacterized protein YbjT (DUF2867 family)
MAPTYLITAASGNIGKRLVPLLLAHKAKPHLVLPTSNAERLTAALPPNTDKSRIRIVQGSIQNPAWVQSILAEYQVTGVFLCLTGDNELFTTFNFLDAIKEAGCVKHLVYLSACGDYDLSAIGNGTLKVVGAAHVAVKFLVEAKLRYGLLPREEDGGFSYTIIGPTLFYDNDLRSKKDMLEEGVFDEPLGSKGVSRVDPEDIALGISKAFEDDGQKWASKKIMIGSLKTYTNQEVAGLWSKALGKEIRPHLSDEAGMHTFEKEFTAKIGPAWARDLQLMYKCFDQIPFGMTEADYQDQVKLLGREPSSYEKFVEETGEAWRG